MTAYAARGRRFGGYEDVTRNGASSNGASSNGATAHNGARAGV